MQDSGESTVFSSRRKKWSSAKDDKACASPIVFLRFQVSLDIEFELERNRTPATYSCYRSTLIDDKPIICTSFLT